MSWDRINYFLIRVLYSIRPSLIFRMFVVSENRHSGFFTEIYFSLFPMFHSVQSVIWTRGKVYSLRRKLKVFRSFVQQIFLLYTYKNKSTSLLLTFESHSITVQYSGTVGEDSFFARVVYILRYASMLFCEESHCSFVGSYYRITTSS